MVVQSILLGPGFVNTAEPGFAMLLGALVMFGIGVEVLTQAYWWCRRRLLVSGEIVPAVVAEKAVGSRGPMYKLFVTLEGHETDLWRRRATLYVTSNTYFTTAVGDAIAVRRMQRGLLALVPPVPICRLPESSPAANSPAPA